MSAPQGGIAPVIIGDIDIEKYGIQSVSIMSEASFTPRLYIRHFDDNLYSYFIKGNYIRGSHSGPGILNDEIYKILKEHIKIHCIKQIRKEKLEKIESLPIYEI